MYTFPKQLVGNLCLYYKVSPQPAARRKKININKMHKSSADLFSTKFLKIASRGDITEERKSPLLPCPTVRLCVVGRHA